MQQLIPLYSLNSTGLAINIYIQILTCTKEKRKKEVGKKLYDCHSYIYIYPPNIQKSGSIGQSQYALLIFFSEKKLLDLGMVKGWMTKEVFLKKWQPIQTFYVTYKGSMGLHFWYTLYVSVCVYIKNPSATNKKDSLNTSFSLYTHTHVYIYIYIYTYTYTYIHTHICKWYVYKHACPHTHIQKCSIPRNMSK